MKPSVAGEFLETSSSPSTPQGGVVVGKLSSILVVGAVLGIVIWLRPAHDLPSVSAREQIRHDVLAAERLAEAPPAVVSDLESELAATGRVVRHRSTRLPSHAAASTDARTTAAIKAQLALDPRLAPLDIEVTTIDGRVTLSGRVESAGDLLRAIQIAFADSSVRQVVSTLQISRRQARFEQPVLPR
jgi:BON domain